MMLAVLHRHAGIAALDQDVLVNAVGGVRISEPAADLAVMLAIQSSLRGKALPDWAAQIDCKSWSQFFLKWIVANPVVTCAIPATSKPRHMEDNMQACHGRLPDEKMRQRMAELVTTF